MELIQLIIRPLGATWQNDLKNPSDETSQVVSILVAYEYKQRVKLSFIYYTYIVLIQYLKPFTSVFKALVYTKTTNNDVYGYTHPWHTYDCLIVHTFEYVMRSGDGKRGGFYW